MMKITKQGRTEKMMMSRYSLRLLGLRPAKGQHKFYGGEHGGKKLWTYVREDCVPIVPRDKNKKRKDEACDDEQRPL